MLAVVLMPRPAPSGRRAGAGRERPGGRTRRGRTSRPRARRPRVGRCCGGPPAARSRRRRAGSATPRAPSRPRAARATPRCAGTRHSHRWRAAPSRTSQSRGRFVGACSRCGKVCSSRWPQSGHPSRTCSTPLAVRRTTKLQRGLTSRPRSAHGQSRSPRALSPGRASRRPAPPATGPRTARAARRPRGRRSGGGGEGR